MKKVNLTKNEIELIEEALESHAFDCNFNYILDHPDYWKDTDEYKEAVKWRKLSNSIYKKLGV